MVARENVFALMIIVLQVLNLGAVVMWKKLGWLIEKIFYTHLELKLTT
jgi:hypothetical protein